MKIYALLQTSYDLEIDNAIYDYGYKNRDDAVKAAQNLIKNHQADYPDKTEIITHTDDHGQITGLEILNREKDLYLESISIQEVIIIK